jgi:hypothetical protein
VGVEDLRAQCGPGQDLAVEAVLGQGQGEQRQWHADGRLVQPDLGGHVGADPHVAGQDEQRFHDLRNSTMLSPSVWAFG